MQQLDQQISSLLISSRTQRLIALAGICIFMLAGCASQDISAPIEDRSTNSGDREVATEVCSTEAPNETDYKAYVDYSKAYRAYIECRKAARNGDGANVSQHTGASGSNNAGTIPAKPPADAKAGVEGYELRSDEFDTHTIYTLHNKFDEKVYCKGQLRIEGEGYTTGAAIGKPSSFSISPNRQVKFTVQARRVMVLTCLGPERKRFTLDG